MRTQYDTSAQNIFCQVHLQFWSGVQTKPGWEAYDLEIYINNVHDEHMIGPFCGFDQWIDNHIAIDAGPGEVMPFFGNLSQDKKKGKVNFYFVL